MKVIRFRVLLFLTQPVDDIKSPFDHVTPVTNPFDQVQPVNPFDEIPATNPNPFDSLTPKE